MSEGERPWLDPDIDDDAPADVVDLDPDDDPYQDILDKSEILGTFTDTVSTRVNEAKESLSYGYREYTATRDLKSGSSEFTISVQHKDSLSNDSSLFNKMINDVLNDDNPFMYPDRVNSKEYQELRDVIPLGDISTITRYTGEDRGILTNNGYIASAPIEDHAWIVYGLNENNVPGLSNITDDEDMDQVEAKFMLRKIAMNPVTRTEPSKDVLILQVEYWTGIGLKNTQSVVENFSKALAERKNNGEVADVVVEFVGMSPNPKYQTRYYENIDDVLASYG